MLIEWTIFALVAGFLLWVLFRFFEWRSRVLRSVRRSGARAFTQGFQAGSPAPPEQTLFACPR
jgi:hypothetical protein